MSAQAHLNSLMVQLTQGYQKTHVIPGHGEIGIHAVKASCGMASLKDEFSDVKFTMDCHDSNQVKIRVESFKGVPMKDIEGTWSLPKQ
jgi:hypothetical protein